jgi:hypothetical protein
VVCADGKLGNDDPNFRTSRGQTCSKLLRSLKVLFEEDMFDFFSLSQKMHTGYTPTLRR